MTTCDCQNKSGKAEACTCGNACSCDGCSCKSAAVSKVAAAANSCCAGRKEENKTCDCQAGTDKATVCTCGDKCSCQNCHCTEAPVSKVSEAPKSCCGGRVQEEKA